MTYLLLFIGFVAGLAWCRRAWACIVMMLLSGLLGVGLLMNLNLFGLIYMGAAWLWWRHCPDD